MGRVATSVDHNMIESFWSLMQRELLDIRGMTTTPTCAENRVWLPFPLLGVSCSRVSGEGAAPGRT